jgi:CBS domain-containing protein
MHHAMTDGIRLADPVAKLMSWPVATVQSETALTEVVGELAADEVGVVLVLARKRLVGIVSERDVVAHLGAGADLSHLSAGEVMVDELVTVDGAVTVLEAARAMVESRVRHLPVLSDGEVVGVVSVRDLLAVLVDRLTEEGQR